MGYIRHNAILVTGWEREECARAHEKALESFKGKAPVSEMIEGPCNTQVSFFIGPDGSKEGWEASNVADAAREKFVAWLRETQEETWLDWMELRFGGDEDHVEVLNASSK